MLSIQIADTKRFMQHLLSGDTFDDFYLVEATIKMGVTYQIEGRLNKEFYDSDIEKNLRRNFCYWKEIRNHIFQIIKGKRRPLSCKIILSLSESPVSHLIADSLCPFRQEDIQGLYLNILYNAKGLLVTTGISYQNFSLDKSLEYAFDDYTTCFLKGKGIC